jgi:hypothetical protein
MQNMAGYFPFISTICLGMTRWEVADYLQSRGVGYSSIYWGGDAWAYSIKIGDEPAREWYCDHWAVYVGLEFDSTSAEKLEMAPSKTDKLREIRINKLGSCL